MVATAATARNSATLNHILNATLIHILVAKGDGVLLLAAHPLDHLDAALPVCTLIGYHGHGGHPHACSSSCSDSMWSYCSCCAWLCSSPFGRGDCCCCPASAGGACAVATSQGWASS